jgi:hypothetical protein
LAKADLALSFFKIQWIENKDKMAILKMLAGSLALFFFPLAAASGMTIA